MGKLKTTEQFIQEAIAVHGNKHDYSLVDYRGNKQKIKIVCSIHGKFEQTPNSHLNGSGCPSCAGVKKLCTNEFIKKAISVHGQKYDYSLINYKGSCQQVKIICKIHGVFEQKAYKHLQGDGCSACSGNRKKDTSNFIQEAQSIHGQKYDYSLTNYKGRHKKVKIICPIHGVFEQRAGGHLTGNGCCACSKTKKPCTDDFIKKAQSVHGDKYDYSLVNYKNNKEKVKIICKTHGVFEQAPSSHYNAGQGCPSCSSGGFDYKKTGLIYFLKFEKPLAVFWKIGITNTTVKKRFGIDCNFITSQFTWTLSSGFDAYKIEQLVLKKFQKYKFDDNFLFSLLTKSGETECFSPSLPYKKVISFIEKEISKIQSCKVLSA